MAHSKDARFYVYAALVFVVIELYYRHFYQSDFYYDPRMQPYLNFQKIFLCSYYCCCLSCIVGKGLLDKYLIKTGNLYSFLTNFQGMDGISMMALGWSMYHNNFIGVSVATIILCRFSLLFLYDMTIVAQQHSHDLSDYITNLTRQYLHHLGSFLFITDPTTMILTTMWRTASIFGHMIIFFPEGTLSTTNKNRLKWCIITIRLFACISVFLLCIVFPTVRKGFIESAAGHVAYMLCR